MKLEEYKKQYAEILSDLRAGHMAMLGCLIIALVLSGLFIILFYTKVINDRITTILGWSIFSLVFIACMRDFSNYCVNQRKINDLNVMYLEELEKRKGE